MYTCVCGFYQVGPMTKFGQPPLLAGREVQRFGPTYYQSPVPRLSSQSMTPRERGGAVSVASSLQGVTPRDRASVTSFNRPAKDKDRKWQLLGWDTETRPADKNEDGIVGWAKRRTNMESKRGTKKHVATIDNEHYFPVQHRCPDTEDCEQFRHDSLHSRFLPKVKVKVTPPQAPLPTLKYSTTGKKDNVTGGLDTERGVGEKEPPMDPVQRVIQNYRDAKQAAILLGQGSMLGSRSKSMSDLHAKYNIEQRNKIRRWLKFSNKERRFNKFDEDEDEGYSSKTSSAETKGLSESDTEEGQYSLSKNRLSTSMINLSELPSNCSQDGQEKRKDGKSDRATKDDTEVGQGKVKFSYTHQPTILQIPHPDMKLVRENVRADRAAASEEVPFSYSRLKRAREINKCYRIDPTKFISENSVYDISTPRPRAESPKAVTLVLRKICIQNAEQRVTAVMNSNTTSLSTALESSQLQRSDSRASSRSKSAMSRAGSSLSRAGSSASQIGSSKSRTGSAKSRANSAAPRCNITPQMEYKTRMQHKSAKPTSNKDSNIDLIDKSLKEPMWSQEYSLIERHATSYCIGDLLPAVDKSIYTNQYVKGKIGTKPHTRKYHGMAPLLTGPGKTAGEEGGSSKDDGYLLLQKGVDALAGDKEKPTLGPPPFRPTPARQQVVRNFKVVVRHVGATRSSPIYGKGSYSPIRFSSEKGPRPMMQSPEKETQRKLKEAFSKFYQNRPKEIGKEFRRMQTMWNG